MAKVTYHKSHTLITLDGKEFNFATQLYQIGVYGIVNNDPSLQSSFQPQQIKKMERDLMKDKKEGKIKDFILGIPITVTDDSGFWVKIY